jgi:hypothetical protein
MLQNNQYLEEKTSSTTPVILSGAGAHATAQSKDPDAASCNQAAGREFYRKCLLLPGGNLFVSLKTP